MTGDGSAGTAMLGLGDFVLLALSVIRLNSTVKLTLTLDAVGKITTCVVTSVKVTVSGLVTAFVPATSLTNGSLTIAGKAYVIATGTAITGVSVGLTLKLELTLNSSGQVTSCRLWDCCSLG